MEETFSSLVHPLPLLFPPFTALQPLVPPTGSPPAPPEPAGHSGSAAQALSCEYLSGSA